MINWDYVRDASVKIDEIAVSSEGTENIIILKGKKYLHGNVFDMYFHLNDVPIMNSEQILSFKEKGNLDTNFIKDILEYTGSYVEKVYLEESFYKGKPTEFARCFLKFSTGEEMKPVSPPTALVFGLASRAEIYVNKRFCHEKDKQKKEMRKIIESADFINLESLPTERRKTEVSFNPDGYEELKNTGISKLDIKEENGKRVIIDILSVNYSKNEKTFLFPIPLPYDPAVLEKYSEELKDSSERKRMKENLEKYGQKDHMEVLNYILNDIRTDSVFINGKIMESPSIPNVFVVEPIDSFIRLKMDELRTFQTSYFFGFNSAFLNLDKIMLKPEVKLSYVS